MAMEFGLDNLQDYKYGERIKLFSPRFQDPIIWQLTIWLIA